MLRKPYAVVDFRYDMLRLAKEDDDYGVDPTPRPTTLLLQRDWKQPKRSRAFDLSAHPLLAELTKGPRTVLDAGGLLSQFTNGFVKELVESLHDRQIVHLMLPAELVGYGLAGYQWEVGKARRLALEALWDGAWHTTRELRDAVSAEAWPRVTVFLADLLHRGLVAGTDDVAADAPGS
ncbi:hypothetical protein [Streptomyces lutosisoli]|uniref:Uncharacterized protein n=1 Tax=Streptomyces lutosisoli TaxID=2665721 RepID=A0ABW2VGP7_9ACTN